MTGVLALPQAEGGHVRQEEGPPLQDLGQAQLEAFEKSLELRKTGRRREEGTRANWIGQAVALVVLYRWYAPQLAEKYSLNYPRLAEDRVLAYLNSEMKNWPARITTG